MGAVPSPASFESIPRNIPIWMAWLTPAPAKPPSTGAGAKACRKMSAKVSGICSKLTKKTTSPLRMNTADMSGTSASENLPIRRTPPMTTIAVTAAMRPVTMYGLIP